jgi:hypothetical protein
VKIRDVRREFGLDVDALALGELEIDGLNHIQFEAYDQGTIKMKRVFTMVVPSLPRKLWMD